MDQTGRQFVTRMKQHQHALTRQDENSRLALHCLITGHLFDWTWVPVVGNGSAKTTREFIEAWKTALTFVDRCTTIDPCYKALRAYWKRKCTYSQAACHPPSFSMFIGFLNNLTFAILKLISLLSHVISLATSASPIKVTAHP